MISEEDIKKNKRFNWIGNKIICLEEIDSTNDEAKRNSHLSDGTIFIAERQKKGKGRMGRKWLSEYGGGICLSILLKPEINSEQLSCITLTAGLAVCNTLKKRGLLAQIKWPNDIVVNKKKICGILSELCFDKEQRPCVILGIGINVNFRNFSEEISSIATSVYLEKGEMTKREELVVELINEFEKCYGAFLNHGFDSIVSEYRKNCLTIGKEVKVTSSACEYTAVALDINSVGELVVKKDGQNIALNSGEVSVRGLYGYI